MNLHLLSLGVLVTIIGGVSKQASAGAELFFDYSEWQIAMGTTTTIGFADLPHGSILTTQYADLGVIFTDGLDIVGTGGFTTFPQDGAGVSGVGSIDLLFSAPMHGIALHYPGYIQYQLYDGDVMIYESVELGAGVYDFFAGVISDRAFDRVLLLDPADGFVFIDNLYFGPPIPSPAGLAVLLCGFLTAGSRRRWRG